MPQAKPLYLMFFVAILGATAGAYVWKSIQPAPTVSDSSVFARYPEPRVLADFTLTGPGDSNWSIEQLRDQWTLVFFGYTSCPDVCPSTLMQLAELRKSMSASMTADSLPQVLFVSVDPERDSSEKIAEYVGYFDPSFIGVTGPDPQIAALSRQLGVAYFIDEHEPGAEVYEVAHSTGVLLLDPQARLVGMFPAPHDTGLVQTELSRLMDTGSG